jgi:hypothetical protein
MDAMTATTHDIAGASPDRIMQLGLGFWASKALLSAVEFDLFTELAAAPRDAEALRECLGLHGRGARDFFDALVALGMLERQDGIYLRRPTSISTAISRPMWAGCCSGPTRASIRCGAR